ncbi:hypothetical protein A6R68_23551 [Neotoma lepida]|uniref:Uncharacterized protein n=1 Tax=Neotoma lepida TaxID=56216 RepID=A0A1A6HWU6_NEOLE|nr:hypothetical protein A6R68_23551 [Neotoma lepida]
MTGRSLWEHHPKSTLFLKCDSASSQLLCCHPRRYFVQCVSVVAQNGPEERERRVSVMREGR